MSFGGSFTSMKFGVANVAVTELVAL